MKRILMMIFALVAIPMSDKKLAEHNKPRRMYKQGKVDSYITNETSVAAHFILPRKFLNIIRTEPPTN